MKRAGTTGDAMSRVELRLPRAGCNDCARYGPDESAGREDGERVEAVTEQAGAQVGSNG